MGILTWEDLQLAREHRDLVILASSQEYFLDFEEPEVPRICLLLKQRFFWGTHNPVISNHYYNGRSPEMQGYSVIYMSGSNLSWYVYCVYEHR